MMGNERRDYGRRADSLCRFMERLRSAQAGLGAAELADDDSLPPDAGQRILKRLALKGFARRVGERWVPTPVLLGPCPLVAGDPPGARCGL